LPLLRYGYQDFTIFYCAGRMVRSGQSHSLYDLSAQYRAQLEFAPNVSIRQAALPYNHPPFEALLFVPFTLLGYWPAYVIWSVFSLTLLIVSLVVLRSRFPPLAAIPPWIFGLTACSFFPVAMGIIQGQDVILFLLLFVFTVICLDKGKEVLAGAVLGVGIFRPQLAVPLLMLFALRRWRVLVGFAPIALILAGISFAMTGWQGPYNYVRFVLHLERTGGSALGSELLPNLRGLIDNLPGLGDSGSRVALVVLCSLAVFVVAALKIARGQESILPVSSLAAVATILVSFHSLVHDLSLLLPLVLLLLSQILDPPSGKRDAQTVVITFLFLSSPIYSFLLLDVHRFFWFSLVLLSIFLVLMMRPSSNKTFTLV